MYKCKKCGHMDPTARELKKCGRCGQWVAELITIRRGGWLFGYDERMCIDCARGK